MTGPLGVHYLLELRGCDPNVTNDLPEVRRILLEAARRAKATILNSYFHQFSPQGVSGVVVVGESHLSVHTWPEYGYASADVYTCGHTDPMSAVRYIADEFRAQSVYLIPISRGEHPQQLALPPVSETTPHWESITPPAGWSFLEFTTPDSTVVLRVNRVLTSLRSDFQHIEVLDTAAFGRVLVLDGQVQSAEADEFIYHEALVHPAMTTHPEPRDVLILGGGEGATLREVLRHPSVRRAVMVEIDPQVIEVCRRDLPEWSAGAFDDPRTQVVIDDAVHYLDTTDDQFDVILSDLTEPYRGALSEQLATQEMFQAIRRHLRPGGILVNQSGSANLVGIDLFASIHRTLRSVFPVVAPYTIQIPSFAEPWGLILASERDDPRALTAEEVDRRLEMRGIRGQLRFYDGAVHRAIFTLPRYFRELLETKGQVLRGEVHIAAPHL